MLPSATGSSSHSPKQESFEMRLTDWLVCLRCRKAWPPEATPARFPVHAALSLRPNSDGRNAGGQSNCNQGWRLHTPTRRIPVSSRRGLTIQPIA
jgi:ribosomal protein L40E